jgi:hypothetical protein
MFFLANVRAKIGIRFGRGKFGGRSIIDIEEFIDVVKSISIICILGSVRLQRVWERMK